MKKILVVVDMQNDFVDGALGTKEAQEIVGRVVEKIKSYPSDCVYATRDTHTEDYLNTQEGKFLPVVHCVEGTEGWQLKKEVAEVLKDAVIVNKPTFGSVALADMIFLELQAHQEIEVELIGVCTDICVVSNALLLKARMPEVTIKVDPSCCAGVTPESHEAALKTMQMCQIVME